MLFPVTCLKESSASLEADTWLELPHIPKETKTKTAARWNEHLAGSVTSEKGGGALSGVTTG